MRAFGNDRVEPRFNNSGWERASRALCYLLGPFFIPVILALRQHSVIWSVRFHTFHATLFGALWGGGWALLRLCEHLLASCWFLSVTARELRFVLNVWFILLWAFLLVNAYTGSRATVFPFLHRLAASMARAVGGRPVCRIRRRPLAGKA